MENWLEPTSISSQKMSLVIKSITMPQYSLLNVATFIGVLLNGKSLLCHPSEGQEDSCPAISSAISGSMLLIVIVFRPLFGREY
jgi:hypothetical protein